MATQEMILKLSFDDEGTFTGLEDINQELAKTDAATKAVEKSTKTLKAQYAELKKQQDQFDPGTEKFNQLSIKMGELKDRMNDAAEAVKGNTGPAIEGARASFGMMGEQMANLDFEGLSQSLNLVSGNLARLKPEDISKGLKSMAEAGINGLKALGKAVLANPLLLIAGIITAIIVNFEKWIHLFPSLENALTGINEQERESLAISKAKADASQKAYENIDKQTNILKLQGKSEKEILNIKLKALETAIADRKAQLAITEKQAIVQVQTAKRNREILEGIIRFLTAPIQALLTTVDDIAHTFGKDSDLANSFTNMAAGLLIDPQELETELNKTIEENKAAIATMENDYAGLQLSIKKMDSDAAKAKADKAAEASKTAKQLADDAKKLAAEADAEARKAYQEKRDSEIEAEDAKFKAMHALQESALEKEITAAIEASEKLYEIAGQDAAAEALIAENLATQIADINKKYADEEKAAREKKNEENAILAVKELEAAKKLEEEKAALRMANIQKGFDMASLGLDALMSLNDAAAKGDEASQRKAFNRNKLMQKAQATIAMAAGIVQQLAVPQDQLGGMNFVKAAAIAAAGIANIVKINQTQFGGGGGGGGGAGANLNAPTGGAGTNAPAVDFSGANMQVNAPGGVETYVLAGNVANALEARQKIIDQSHL